MKKCYQVLLCLAVTAGFLATPAHAYKQGDIIVRAGIADVNPNDDSDALPAIPGATVDVEDDWSLGLTMSYMMSDRLGLGVLAAVPFKHDIEGSGTISALGTIAETKQLPPTVTLQYHFKTGSQFHPYIGAGINYTNFFSEDAKGAISASKISLDDSWGLALEAGVDVDLNKDWVASAQVWYVDIDTEAKISGGIFATPQNIDVEIDPWVVMFSVGRKF